MIPPEDLDPFVRETLGELHKTTADAKDQRHTLEVLLDVNMNVAEASRILHFHYNTLRYRIAKLEGLVGPFTTDRNLLLELALALWVFEYQEAETSWWGRVAPDAVPVSRAAGRTRCCRPGP